MSWLLEILWSIFAAIFDLARPTMPRNKSRPTWFHDGLTICYYVLPTLIVVSVLVSRRISVIATGLFIASLVAGAVTETDDLRGPVRNG